MKPKNEDNNRWTPKPSYSQDDVNRENEAWGKVVFSRKSNIDPIKDLGKEVHALFKQVCNDSLAIYIHSQKRKQYTTLDQKKGKRRMRAKVKKSLSHIMQRLLDVKKPLIYMTQQQRCIKVF